MRRDLLKNRCIFYITGSDTVNRRLKVNFVLRIDERVESDIEFSSRFDLNNRRLDAPVWIDVQSSQ